MSVGESPREAAIAHKVILFRLNRYFRLGMNDEKVYEGTRGVWAIDQARAKNAQYALGVFDGVVRGVYSVDEWHEAGTTKYRFRAESEMNHPGRWEFTGRTAPPEILERYLGKSVRKYMAGRGAFEYVNI
ncbi:MAG: hypothetical protein ACR2QC_07055 [Gammaproteobacteria bacterium]